MTRGEPFYLMHRSHWGLMHRSHWGEVQGFFFDARTRGCLDHDHGRGLSPSRGMGCCIRCRSARSGCSSGTRHLGKALFPGVVTGKLSDVAGLVFFPLLLQGLWELALELSGRRWAPSRRVLGTVVALTAVVFAAINLWEPASDLWRHGLGFLQWPARAAVGLALGEGVPSFAPVRAVVDPTDLVALPAVALPLWLGRRRASPRRAG